MQRWYQEKCMRFPVTTVARAEQFVTLRAIDTHWMAHIDDMAHLREQVAFAGFAQRDPLIEYQDQGFRRFEQLLATIDSTIVRALLQIDFAQFVSDVQAKPDEEKEKNMKTNEGEIGMRKVGLPAEALRSLGSRAKVGRNDPCPCGSGKKYKKCHSV